MTETDADTIPLLFITLHSMGVDLGDGRNILHNLSTVYTIPIFVVIAVVVKCKKSFVEALFVCTPLKYCTK